MSSIPLGVKAIPSCPRMVLLSSSALRLMDRQTLWSLSVRDYRTAFGAPEPVDGVNGPGDETDPWSSSDGGYLHFISDRAGTQDLYLQSVDAQCGDGQLRAWVMSMARDSVGKVLQGPSGDDAVFVVSLTIREPDGSRAEREVRAAVCAEAVDAMGLIVALAIEPHAALKSQAAAAGDPELEEVRSGQGIQPSS
jgi:hypothetical protein